MYGQLKFPLDQQSKRIIETTVDEFLDAKIHSNLWKRTFHWITFFEGERNILYMINAHSSCNGVFPGDIYRQMLSTFRLGE